MFESEKALSITELNTYVKELIDSDEILQSAFIIGEISNFKRHGSGHLYFSLKDQKCSVKAVMFAQRTGGLNFELKDGSKVFVYGYVSCYTTAGQYQVYACRMLPAGIGEINEALEKLRVKLSAEGLFDESRKINIPKFPEKIGVVTSKTGAVIHDITGILARRYKLGTVVLVPVQVQGAEAPRQIAEAIFKLDDKPEVDVIIVGRGGGSLEELWAFNDESVVRAVANCKTAVISAVGHDVDYTLCDFAADARAPTPSAAAELASVNLEEISNLIKIFYSNSKFYISKLFSDYRNSILRIKSLINKSSPDFKINELKLELSQISFKIKSFILKILNDKKNKFLIIKKNVSALNPDLVLKRGYCCAESEGRFLRSAADLKDNTELNLIFSDGIVKFDVKNLVKICKNL
jgi:exodeoxyribonuclease VII large subunit